VAEPSKLFLSYAHKDGGNLAPRLLKDLADCGYDPWLDRERLTGGSSWSREIEEHLDQADIVLALLSAGSFESEICRGEQLRSLRKNKCVIPLLVHTGADRPVYLEAKHFLDFSEDATYALRLKDLESAIKSRTGATLAPKFKVTRFDTVPPLPQNFVPRPAELEALRQTVLSDRDRRHVALVALRGMGGIGKTVLAQALCRDEAIQAAFPDGIVWVRIGERPTDADLVNQMREAARAAGCSADGFDTRDHSSNLLRSLLKDKMVLLVLDDVWDSAPVYHFQPADDARFCRLLFTTRDNEIAASVGAHSQSLDILDEWQSHRLFATYAGREEKDFPPQAAGILRECHGLPLALAMVGALLRNKSLPLWDDILDSLRNADLDAIKLKFPNYEYPSLVAAIEISVNHLDDDEKNCYLDLAIFPDDTAIPQAALEVAWGLDGKNARRIKEHLAGLSLLACDDSNRITLHDLQMDYVRKRAGSALRKLHSRLLDRYKQRCSGGWHGGPDDGYFFEHLTYHFSESGQFSELAGLLLNHPWLDRKMKVSGITSLLADFDLALRSRHDSAEEKLPGHTLGIPPWRIIEGSGARTAHTETSGNHDFDEPLKLVRGAIQLSAHVITKDPSQFASQMAGRLLLHQDQPGIRDFLASLAVIVPRPWLRPLRPTLHSPGTALLRTLEGHSQFVKGVAISPNGRHAISASLDKTLRVWDLETGRILRILEGHSHAVNGVAISPDGQSAVSACEDKTLKVWNLESGCILCTLEGHFAPVTSVAIAPNGGRVLSASEDNTLKVWDLEAGRELLTLKGHTLSVYAVATTPDGRRAISASRDQTLKVWDLATGRILRTLEGHSSSVQGVAVTPDGRRAVSASWDQTLKVWDLDTGRALRTLCGHSSRVTSVAIAPDGRHAVSASGDNTLKVWDLESSHALRTLEGHSSLVTGVTMSPSGSRAVSASHDMTLKVWDLEGRRELPSPEEHSGAVWGTAATPDGRRAATVSADKTLKVWDLETGRILRTLEGHSLSVYGVVVSPDGRRAVTASWDKTLKVWDLETGRALRTFEGHSQYIYGVAMTPDGRRAVSASRDQTLKVWDLVAGRELRTMQGHIAYVYGVALTPDGRRAVSASWDKTLKVWNLDTGRELRTLLGHSDIVYSVTVTPDGQRAVSASADNTLKVWDLDSGRELRTLLGHTSWVNGVAMSPDGRHVVSVSRDNTLKLWNLEQGTVAASFTCDWSTECCTFAGARRIVAGDFSGRVHLLSLELDEQTGMKL
jgi:WD40 repeat protein